MSKMDAARMALERIRTAANAGATASPQDVEMLIEYFGLEEKALLGAVDLLNQSRNAFRSKQVERARKLLEELMGPETAAQTMIVVETWALGNQLSKEDIRGITHDVLGAVGGAWTLDIRGAHNNDLWQAALRGPSGFSHAEADIGPRHDAAGVRAFLERALKSYQGGAA